MYEYSGVFVVVVDLVWLLRCGMRLGRGRWWSGRFRCGGMVVLRGFLIGLDVERAIGGSAAGCGSFVCVFMVGVSVWWIRRIALLEGRGCGVVCYGGSLEGVLRCSSCVCVSVTIGTSCALF
ncbi:hypothetical protein M758_2G028400 [Ceratodon purpureus]|nr:hypothetical protein M758_2G028400 [Ceratodon purpureus]